MGAHYLSDVVMGGFIGVLVTRALAVAFARGRLPFRMRPRTAAALRDSEELLRKFKEIATLQRIDVPRPADRATDFAQGALAARGLGMRRLAERLQEAATA